MKKKNHRLHTISRYTNYEKLSVGMTMAFDHYNFRWELLLSVSHDLSVNHVTVSLITG